MSKVMTEIVEAILFASGNAVAEKDLIEKVSVTVSRNSHFADFLFLCVRV